MADTLERLRSALGKRFAIEREIARGGFAAVYLAQDRKHRRPVAIKVLHRQATGEVGAEAFLREIRITAGLTHPHILPLLDSGSVRGLLYYVMPFVGGESLRDRLARRKPLPVDEAVRVAAEVASALDYAHRQGILHRDIKPGNILLEEGHAVVADFGIACALRSVEEDITEIQLAVGTPAYMSPEQVSGGEIDARSDLYSLACVLYEMLTGQPPFTGPSTASVLHQQLAAPTRDVTELRPDVPTGVAAALALALAKAPGDRFPSMSAFAEELWAGLAAVTARPPSPSPSVFAGALPQGRTSFIGRERELAECERLLRETRLLTLTGIGGCGKTRLAIRLAERLRDAFPDGVWFVDLAAVADAAWVPQAVASALGLREERGTALGETIADFLAGRRALLVLDNCEHLVDACAALADGLLAAAPDLRLLVTSRETLCVPGERPFGVRSLTVAPAGAEGDLAALAASESARLFLDRARAVAPEFALDAETAAAVAEICRRLDGIPLAIELAAARTEVLSVEQIRDKLDDRLRLLTSGGRALPRHQTLRTTLQWSYDHLTEEEQSLFQGLSVFVGGWTLAAAIAVAGEGTDEFDVLQRLTGLIHKSLVVVEPESGGERRYRMLETVRLYGQEQLVASGRADETRARHLDYYLALAELAAQKVRGPEGVTWRQRLDYETANLLAAQAWCDHVPGGGEKGLRLVAAQYWHWRSSGLDRVAIQEGRRALERAGSQADTQARAMVLLNMGLSAMRRGLCEEARVFLEGGLAVAERIDFWMGRVLGSSRLGTLAREEGDGASARRHLVRAVEIAEASADSLLLSMALNNLGDDLRGQGELEEASRLFERALAQDRERGDGESAAIRLINLAQILIAQETPGPARERLQEALALGEQLGSRWILQVCLDVGVGLAALMADGARAARLFGASQAMLERMNRKRDYSEQRFLERPLARVRAELGEDAMAAGAAAGRALAGETAVLELRDWLAELEPRVRP